MMLLGMFRCRVLEELLKAWVERFVLTDLNCRERDLLHRVFTEKRAGIYVGIDPTAPSMHVGHMLPFMVLAWGYVWGLPVTFLVGSLVLESDSEPPLTYGI